MEIEKVPLQSQAHWETNQP
jgi:hypothetical protein